MVTECCNFFLGFARGCVANLFRHCSNKPTVNSCTPFIAKFATSGIEILKYISIMDGI